jgi:hypothetical protein
MVFMVVKKPGCSCEKTLVSRVRLENNKVYRAQTQIV